MTPADAFRAKPNEIPRMFQIIYGNEGMTSRDQSQAMGMLTKIPFFRVTGSARKTGSQARSSDNSETDKRTSAQNTPIG